MTAEAIHGSVLEVTDLEVKYRSGALGVHGLSLRVEDHDVVTLIGPNGAGKTSSLRGISGVLARDEARITAGRVVFLGKDVTGRGPLQLAKLGMAMVPERDKIFAGLTVEENLRLGGGIGRGSYRQQRELALDIFPAIGSHLSRLAGYLSGGQRQMLALGMALCANPKLLIVDELTQGLSPELIRTMVEGLHKLVDLGLPILMAEQSLTVALELSRHVYVLDGGSLLTSGTPDSLADENAIATAFLGRR